MLGFLAFREFPLIMKTVERLKCRPDIYMFNDNGHLRPHHMGIATYASFYINTPSICAVKTFFRINDTNYTEPDCNAGKFTDIAINNKLYGKVLHTHNNIKLVFISIGNNISLDTSTRLADLEAHETRRLLNI